MSPRYSLVVPFFNEAGNIGPVLRSAEGVLAALGRTYEVVLVNDGSTDATGPELAAAAAAWPACRVLALPARSGQASALLAGLRDARGDIILTMDGDGQSDPADLPALIKAVEAGRLDLACGWRTGRGDALWRRAASRLANLVRRAVLGDGVHDAGCQLRAMRRDVLGVLGPVEFLQAFIPALAASGGFRVGEIPVRHHPRLHGRSKYGIAELWWRPAVAMLRMRRALGRRSRP
jgi:glycosyltransferase involved in cell wall biosynthesis